MLPRFRRLMQVFPKHIVDHFRDSAPLVLCDPIQNFTQIVVQAHPLDIHQATAVTIIMTGVGMPGGNLSAMLDPWAEVSRM